MFEGTVATGKNAWILNSQIPKDNTESSRKFFDNEEFVDSSTEFDKMDVKCPLLSRAGLESNKGKGLARNVRLCKGIQKNRGKKCSAVKEMSDS